MKWIYIFSLLTLTACTKQEPLREVTYSCLTQGSCYSCYWEKEWPNKYTLKVKCKVGQQMCSGTQQVWLTSNNEIAKMSACVRNNEDYWKLEENWR